MTPATAPASASPPGAVDEKKPHAHGGAAMGDGESAIIADLYKVVVAGGPFDVAKVANVRKVASKTKKRGAIRQITRFGPYSLKGVSFFLPVSSSSATIQWFLL
jgi:hypothetical protein